MGLDGEPPSARHRVSSVDREVDDGVLELAGVHLDGADARVGFEAELDVLADQRQEQPASLGEHLVDAHELRMEHLAAAEGEELSREVRGSLAGLADLEQERAARVIGREIREHDLAITVDHRQEVGDNREPLRPPGVRWLPSSATGGIAPRAASSR